MGFFVKSCYGATIHQEFTPYRSVAYVIAYNRLYKWYLPPLTRLYRIRQPLL